MKLKRSLFFLLLATLSYVSCTTVADVDELTWGEWRECSRPCGGGIQSRRAVCGAGLEPQTCMYLKSTIARKQLKEQRPCNTQSCTGTWGDWTDWLPCSSTCGAHAYQMRSRTCHDGNNIQGSLNCDGLTYEWLPCEGLPPCPSTSHSNDPNSGMTGNYELYSSFLSYSKLSQEEDLSSSSSYETY